MYNVNQCNYTYDTLLSYGKNMSFEMVPGFEPAKGSKKTEAAIYNQTSAMIKLRLPVAQFTLARYKDGDKFRYFWISGKNYFDAIQAFFALPENADVENDSVPTSFVSITSLDQLGQLVRLYNDKGSYVI